MVHLGPRANQVGVVPGREGLFRVFFLSFMVSAAHLWIPSAGLDSAQRLQST